MGVMEVGRAIALPHLEVLSVEMQSEVEVSDFLLAVDVEDILYVSLDLRDLGEDEILSLFLCHHRRLVPPAEHYPHRRGFLNSLQQSQNHPAFHPGFQPELG